MKKGNGSWGQGIIYSVWAFFAVVAIWPAGSEAKIFRNSYVSFELADRWDCKLEQTEWVCKTNSPGLDRREAIIILTAKEVGPSDSLEIYEAHLRKQRSIASRTGKPLVSQVLKVEKRLINSHPWIDGMHMGSEVPNYFTRYLATVKEKIALLVTFSAHKLHYSKYSSDFFRAIESLRVVAPASGSGAGEGASGMGAGVAGSEVVGPGGGAGWDPELPEEGSGSGKGGGGFGSTAIVLIAAALLVGLGLFLLLPKKKPKKRK